MTKSESASFDPTPLPRWLTVGFSGHRHLHGNDEAVRVALRGELATLAMRHGLLAGVCSAASGADTLFAEEMLARDADLTVILPFAVDRFGKDFVDEPAGSWDRATAVLRRARHVDVVHQLEVDVAGAIEDRSATADRDAQAYLEATARTVERSDLLLAVWDGAPGSGMGGTASAVQYAERLGRPCVIYNPVTATVRTERLDRLQACAPTPDVDPFDLRQQVEKYADDIDDRATRHARSARRLTKSVIYLQLFASAFGATTLTVGLFDTLPIVPALFEVLLLGIILYLIYARGGHYQGWLPDRVKAEVCRTFLATWDVRRHPTLVHQPRPAIPDHPELFRLLRAIRQADRSPRIDDLEMVRTTYLRDRVDGQIHHYRSKLDQATASFRTYRGALVATNYGSIVTSIAVVLLLPLQSRFVGSPSETRHFLWVLLTCELLSALLPLAMTAANVMLISQEASRRNRRYGQMVDQLNLARVAVAAAPTWGALARAVTELEELLLQELIEWHAFVENTEHVH